VPLGISCSTASSRKISRVAHHRRAIPDRSRPPPTLFPLRCPHSSRLFLPYLMRRSITDSPEDGGEARHSPRRGPPPPTGSGVQRLATIQQADVVCKRRHPDFRNSWSLSEPSEAPAGTPWAARKARHPLKLALAVLSLHNGPRSQQPTHRPNRRSSTPRCNVLSV
jgi:hypothetical protein